MVNLLKNGWNTAENTKHRAHGWRYVVWRVVRLVLRLHVIFMAYIALATIALIWVNPPFHSLMLYRHGFKFWEISRPSFIALDEVPKQFKKSLVLLEDPNFYKHYGFDLGAIRSAYKLNKQMGYSAYGGSTLSQQLARTFFLVPTKNYLRKYLELIAAVELDFILSKDRILELYINSVEWGDDIFGLQDASKFHYKKDTANLTVTQQFKLITILASPINYTPETYSQNRMLRVRYRFLRRNK